MGMPTDKPATFWKAVGCPDCMDTGYKGRIAVFEILVLDHNIKQAFRQNAHGNELRKAVEESGFEPMLVNCRRLVENGTTTVSEAVRILHSTDS